MYEILDDIESDLPCRVDFEPGVCGRCDFQPWCVPDITKAQGIIDLMDNEELEADCQLYLDTKDPRDAYEKANKRIGAHCKALLDGEAVGVTKTIITKGCAITAKKNKSSVGKTITSLDEVNKGAGNE